MNRFFLRLCVTAFAMITLVLSVTAAFFPSTKEIGNTIETAIPTAFGYIDNTDYFLSHEFSSLTGLEDAYIVTCADSTNFNEFGIFCMKDRSDVKTAKKILRSYLDRRKREFEGGVIYNVEEYPKFQNASVFSVDRYLCYTILTPSDVQKATDAVKNMLTP